MRRSLLLLGLLAIASTVHAQSGIELTPYIGYRGGGELRAEAIDPFGKVEVRESESYGFIIGIPLAPWSMIELEAGFQDSVLTENASDFNPGLVIGGVDVNYYQVGFVYQTPGPKFQGFGVIGLGATTINPDLQDLTRETKFSTSFGGGIKLNFSQNLGLRFEGRGYYTLIDSNRDHCCYDYEDGLWQGEARAGLVARF